MKDITSGSGSGTESESESNKGSHNDRIVSFPAQRFLNDRRSYNAQYDTQPIEATYVEEDEINLRDLWQVLVRRKWVLLIFFLMAVSVTIIATYLSTPIYRSSLTLQINKDAPKVLDYQDITPSESVYEKDFYQTQYELLKSRSLAQRVIDRLDLKNSPHFIGEETVANDENSDGIAALLGVNQSGKSETINASLQKNILIKRFLDNLTIEPVKRSRLVKIHYDSADANLAASISNAVAKNYINMSLERRFDASSYAKTFIEDRLRQIKASLEDSEREINDFARDNEIINISDAQPIVLRQLQQVNDTLAIAEKKRIEAEALYLEMLETKGQGLNKILDSSVIQQLKQLKAELESEYQEKLNIYKPAYPTMIQLQRRIKEIQQKTEDEIANIRSAIFSSYKAQKREETLLLEKLSKLKKQVLDLQDRSIRYKILQRETNTNKQLYQGLLQRMKEVGVAGGISTNNITIIDKAEIPVEKHKPNLSLNVLLAIIFGLIGGIFLAFFFEYFDDTIKAPADLEKYTQLPVLGLIPELKSIANAHTTAETDLGLLSYNDPRSAIAEAYRSTRTALQFSTPSGAPDILLVTSASPGEGKTTSALNIATTFSQMGNKVLLIDTDLRNPSIHTELGMDNSKGLTNYLAGDAKPLDISRHTQVTRLFAIPSGPLPPNPAELLTSEKMKALLDQAKEKFDCVVLDGPPVMGLADALLLANVSDGTVVVVESGTTRHEHLQAALKRLQSTKAAIVGGILSKYSPRSGEDYYNSYYYYQREDAPDYNNQLPENTQSIQKQVPS